MQTLIRLIIRSILFRVYIYLLVIRSNKQPLKEQLDLLNVEYDIAFHSFRMFLVNTAALRDARRQVITRIVDFWM